MKKYLLSAVVIFGFLFYSTVSKPASSKTTVTLNLPSPIPTDIPSTSSPKHNTSQPTPSPQPGRYKNGTYTGTVADAYYGNVQVAAVIQNGKLVNVNILQSPNDRQRSIAINSFAMPVLQSEAVQAQSATVDIVSGATDSSSAFIESLNSALSQAVN